MMVELGSDNQLCVHCKERRAVYKCPGCTRRTCSASCSFAHKSTYNCNGKRNRTAFVPLKDYTWGSMMDDYVYLEDTGRQISKWASNITGNRLMKPSSRRQTKRHALQAHLESVDIHMELAPVGMQRQTLNRSTWKQKPNTVLLTIGYSFHKSNPSGTYDLLTHMSPIEQPFRQLFMAKLHECKAGKHPSWVTSLVPQSANLADLMFCIRQMRDAPGRPFDYHHLDVSGTLSQALKGTTFVEFPQIEVYSKKDAPSQIDQCAIPASLEEPARKRQRMEPSIAKPSRAPLHALMQYDSDTEPSDREGEPGLRNALSAINSYSDGSSSSEVVLESDESQALR